MSALDRTQTALPAGARPLGLRVAPQLRLAMGYRDEERRGAPVKTDYFIAKRGAKGEYDRQADKFYGVFGEKPKQLRILLPPELRHALTITYKAWGSSGDDEGGVLKAIGSTNFALEDYVGGADVLTVWNPDGSVVEVETAGLDANTGEPLDDVARDLGIELYTTFRFMVPDVLGFGNFAEITTKGKKSTDLLWAKLGFYYGLFKSNVTLALDPLYLVIRPDTARPIVVNKQTGEAKRIKSSIYVLDLVPAEAQQEMLDRLAQRRAVIDGVGGHAAALYGPPTTTEHPALPPSSAATPPVADAPPAAEPARPAEAGSATGEPVGGASTAGSTDPAPAFEGEEPSAFRAPPGAMSDEEAARAAAAVAAGETVVPGSSKRAGMKIAQVAEQGPDAVEWLCWAATAWKSEPFKSAVKTYVEIMLPTELAAYREKEAQKAARREGAAS
jgi:hypothetical protein